MKIIIILMLIISQVACVTNIEKKPSYILPGHLYSGKIVNIKAPGEPHWFLASASENGMQFGRVNTEINESFGAQVLSFPLPATESNEAFIQLIRAAAEENTDTGRYTNLDTSYNYSNERSYPCIRSKSTVNDTKAKVSNSQTVEQTMQIIALYCRHPVYPEGGIAIVYSRRGKGLLNNLEVQANKFISGVQVPNYENK